MTWDRYFASIVVANVHRTLIAACFCTNDQFQATLIADVGGCMKDGIAINRVVSYLVRHRGFNFDAMYFLIHGCAWKWGPYFKFCHLVWRFGYDDRVGHFKTAGFPHRLSPLSFEESSKSLAASLRREEWSNMALVPGLIILLALCSARFFRVDQNQKGRPKRTYELPANPI